MPDTASAKQSGQIAGFTLTRAGANTYSFSVSDNSYDLPASAYFDAMYYSLADSVVDGTPPNCAETHNLTGEKTFTEGGQTYSGVITGNAGKYLCIHGANTPNSLERNSDGEGPLTYPGPDLTLNSAGDDNKYETGDHIEVTADFGYAVTVTGTPQIALTIGGATRQAAYTSGSDELVFRYTVVAADNDQDGVSIAANAPALNSGTLKDSLSRREQPVHPVEDALADLVLGHHRQVEDLPVPVDE